MKKVSLILLGLAILIVLVSVVLNACNKPVAEPESQEAKYIIEAGQRYYYTDNYDVLLNSKGQYIVLHGYYDTQDGKDWVYHKGDLPLSYYAYPDMKITNRTGPDPLPKDTNLNNPNQYVKP